MKLERGLFFLFGMWICFSVADILFLHSDMHPPAWDQAEHLMLSLQYRELLMHGDLIEMLLLSNFYPPLVHLLALPFSTSYQLSAMVNILFFGILMFAVYGIGKHLYTYQVGLFSALVVALYPILVALRRDFMLDFALVAMCALATYFLVMSEEFHTRKYSILFGVAFGLALLTKWTALIFISIPLAVAIMKILFDENTHEQEWNITLSLVACSFIAFPWYIANPEAILRIVLANRFFSQLESNPPFMSFQSFWYYISATADGLSVIFILLFILGFFILVWRGSSRQKHFAAVTILFPYLLMSLVYHKNERYLLPVLAFIAIISAAVISDSRLRKAFKITLISVVFIVGIVQFVVTAPIPMHEDWQIDNVLDRIESDMSNGMAMILVLPDHSYVNGKTYDYYARRRGMNCNIQNAAYLNQNPLQPKRELSDFDYVVVKRGGHIVGNAYREKVELMYTDFEQDIRHYTPLFMAELPDGSDLEVWKKE